MWFIHIVIMLVMKMFTVYMDFIKWTSHKLGQLGKKSKRNFWIITAILPTPFIVGGIFYLLDKFNFITIEKNAHPVIVVVVALVLINLWISIFLAVLNCAGVIYKRKPDRETIKEIGILGYIFGYVWGISFLVGFFIYTFLGVIVPLYVGVIILIISELALIICVLLSKELKVLWFLLMPIIPIILRTVFMHIMTQLS